MNQFLRSKFRSTNRNINKYPYCTERNLKKEKKKKRSLRQMVCTLKFTFNTWMRVGS